MREILSRCEALDLRRLVIPALATGAAGLSAETSAAIIARALLEHTVNPTALKSVTLPVPDLGVRQAFARELGTRCSKTVRTVRRSPKGRRSSSGSRKAQNPARHVRKKRVSEIASLAEGPESQPPRSLGPLRAMVP